MPLSINRHTTSQSHGTLHPGRSLFDSLHDHASPDTRHQFWLADLKAKEHGRIDRTPCPSSSSHAGPKSLERGAQMHYRASELASITEQFREPPPSAAGRLTDDDLLIMSRLSRDIASSLAEVARHHRRREGRGSRIEAPSRRQLERLGIADGCRREPSRRGKKQTSFFSCQRCHAETSPQWRRGPDGAGTLCNVCGLLYARRERKRKLAWRSAGSSDDA